MSYDECEPDDMNAAHDAGIGADRMALGLGCIPHKVRGDLGRVQSLLARITALESDAEVDAQLIRDKDADIERLKADAAAEMAGNQAFRAKHGALPYETWDAFWTRVCHLAATRQPPVDMSNRPLPKSVHVKTPFVDHAPTRQPPSSECLIAGMTCPCPCHSRQPLREMLPEVNDYCCRVCSPKWWGMFLCKMCGNKRCPHATNHLLDCTDSNEYGQAGSVYCDSPRGGEGESGGHKERP